MIRVNLLGEKIDNSFAQTLQVLGFSSAVVLSLVLCVVMQNSMSSKLERMEKEKVALNKELEDLKKTTKLVKDLEQNKKTLKEKLYTIATLKAKKQGPVRVLDEVNNVLPERSWLLEMKDKDGTLEISGVALDNQTIATFMHDLEESEFLGAVELIKSEQSFVNDVKVKMFSLAVKLENPLELNKEKLGEVKGSEVQKIEKGAVAGKADKRASLAVKQ